MSENKFQFDVDLQQEILQFTVTDLQAGFKTISLFESQYFTTIEHMVIAEGIKRYFERKFTVPSKAVLKEELRTMLKTKKWSALLLPNDREKTLKIINRIYARPVRNAESIYEKCRKFAQYCALKETLENVDLDNFDAYEGIAPTIQRAVNKGTEKNEDKGMFLIADAKSRIIKRLDSPPGHPTPYWQLNDMTNNGGTSPGNIITVMGEEKKFKTGFLLNTARGYLRQGKIILISDFENGEDSLGLRADQSLMGKTRKDMAGGRLDNQLLKLLRKYKRFGGEIIIKRFDAGQTAYDVDAYMQKLFDEHGLIIDIWLCDYPDVMGSAEKKNSEHERIGQVYLEIKNVAARRKIEATYCPSHITREASKTSNKKRRTSDSSKSQDKSRHADINLSLEQTPEEHAAGVMRLEMVNQRDGVSDGRIWFWADIEKQRIKELNRTEAKEMEELRREQIEANGDQEEQNIIRSKMKKKVSDI